MIIDCHGHFSAPDALYSLKAMLLASRGTAGKGQSANKLTEEHIKAHVEGGGSSVHGTKGHLDNLVMGSECPGTGTAICPHDGHQYDDVASYIKNIDWLSDGDKDKIFHHNAVKLFKLDNAKPRIGHA